ncbi:MAG: hypothetical protein Q4E13_04260 [Clostridia bacterium]|nr:hypothetical protein [Clostridia bacterium]
MAAETGWNESNRPASNLPDGGEDWMQREDRAPVDGRPWTRMGELPVEFGETEECLNPDATGGMGWHDGLLPEQDGDQWAPGNMISGAGLLSKGGEDDG